MKCYRTDTSSSGPHSISLHSVVQDRCTPCRRTPLPPHTFWSNAATVPTNSSRRPQPPVVKHKQEEGEKRAVRVFGQRSVPKAISAAQSKPQSGLLGFSPLSVLARCDSGQTVLKCGTCLLSASARVPATCVTHC